MARSNISIPDDLRRRMDAVEGERINWSAIACRAFETRLAELITKTGVKDMQDVVTRLRASKAKSVNSIRAAGQEAGREWAKAKAEADELERLSAMFEQTDWDRMIDFHPDAAYSPGETLVFALHHDLKGDRQAARHFYSGVATPNQLLDPEFINGFAEGALAIWEAVEAQVNAPERRVTKDEIDSLRKSLPA